MRTWSVGRHMVAATVIVVVFFVAVGAYSAYDELDQAKQSASRAAVSQAATVAQAMTAGWTLVANQVSSLAVNPSAPAVFADPSTCRLSFSLDLIPGGHLDLVTPAGRVVCSSAPSLASKMSQVGAGWLAMLPSAKGAVESPPFRDAVTGQMAVALAAPVRGSTGQLLGVVMAVAPMGAMADQLAQEYGSDQHYRYAITDASTGTVLSAPRLVGASSGSSTRNPISSGGYIYGSATARLTGWTVYAGVKPSVALDPIWAIVIRESALAALALLMFLALLAGIRWRVAVPLRKLTAVIGDSGPHVDAVLASLGGTTEVASLASAFRQMCEGRDAYEERLSHQALHDPLTGLPNRALLADRLSHALAQSARSPGQVAVLFVDIDRFKLINDTLGHTVGDQVLVSLADRLRRLVRVGDTLARFGGDEFVVVCEDLPDAGAAIALAQRLADAVDAPLEVSGQVVRLTVSIGIALAEAGSASEQLLSDADSAMYQAKQQGRARCEVFDPKLREASASRLALETELRTALERGELGLAYQPKIDLRSGRIDSIETLLRWDHPALGAVPPNTFIPIAEETGLILALGLFALDAACHQTAAWRQQGLDLAVSVNMSGRQLADPHLASQIAAILDQHDLPADHLCLELTESTLMADPNRSSAALAKLKGLGLQISIDDFGTGYSSLSYLQRFPVDELKIDRTFVTDLTDSLPARELVAAIVAMGDALGLQVVAEGVETEAQAAQLLDLGCHSAQGFLFARPAPSAAITPILTARANRAEFLPAR